MGEANAVAAWAVGRAGVCRDLKDCIETSGVVLIIAALRRQLVHEQYPIPLLSGTLHERGHAENAARVAHNPDL